MKDSLVVRVIAKWHVVVIALNIYAAASSAAIAEPGALKEPTLPPRHEMLEVFNSGLQCRESETEKGVNIFGPIGGVRVDGTKLCKNDGAEISASLGAATSMSSTVTEPCDEARGKDSAGNRPEIGKNELYGFLHGALIGEAMMIYMLWTIRSDDGMKPNVVVNGGPAWCWRPKHR